MILSVVSLIVTNQKHLYYAQLMGLSTGSTDEGREL